MRLVYMYGFPKYLDLSSIVGQSTTQVHVGQYDIQFSFGKVNFAIQSTIKLLKNGQVLTSWNEGSWPPPEFYEIMNSDVRSYSVLNEKELMITLENEIDIILVDDSDQYESMQIYFEDGAVEII